MCHMSGLMCQVSGATWQVSGVTCNFLIKFLQSGGANRLRVCYQRGLRPLVSICNEHTRSRNMEATFRRNPETTVYPLCNG